MAERTCSIEGCGGRHKARGWCETHYVRWWRFGDPLSEGTRFLYRGQPCAAGDCDKPARSGGYCAVHYERVKRHGTTDLPVIVRPPTDYTAYFWARVAVTPSCWLWTGHSVSGYGRAQVAKRRTSPAHRVAYELLVGPIPDGLTIDHLCHNQSDCPGGPTCLHRRCVNPAHLEAVTSRVNTLRGRTPAAANAAKTHCPQGHPYDARDANGDRMCRTCRRASWRAFLARKRPVQVEQA